MDTLDLILFMRHIFFEKNIVIILREKWIFLAVKML